MLVQESGVSSKNQRIVLVCSGSGCPGGAQIIKHLENQIAQSGLDIVVKPTGCHGFCQVGPTVMVQPEDIFYCHVSEDDVAEITQTHLRDNRVVNRLLYIDPASGQTVPHYSDINFYKKQQRILLRNCGQINPEKIEDYIACGGYQSLRKVLFNMTPGQVRDEIKKAGLRGRGGAGFPTATKWEFCCSAPG